MSALSDALSAEIGEIAEALPEGNSSLHLRDLCAKYRLRDLLSVSVQSDAVRGRYAVAMNAVVLILIILLLLGGGGGYYYGGPMVGGGIGGLLLILLVLWLLAGSRRAL